MYSIPLLLNYVKDNSLTKIIIAVNIIIQLTIFHKQKGEEMSNLVVIVDSVPMKVSGGYRHPNKGCCLTVFSTKGERSISVWRVEFPDNIEKNTIFIKLFGLSYRDAKRIDRKKGLVAA